MSDHPTDLAQGDLDSIKKLRDGSWSGGYIGPVFTTATYLTVLQLENGNLPIYQRLEYEVVTPRPEPAAVLRFSGESVPITAVPSVFSAFGRVWCARVNAPQV